MCKKNNITTKVREKYDIGIKEYLVDQYHNQDICVKDIAKELGCSIGSVNRIMKLNHIPTKVRFNCERKALNSTTMFKEKEINVINALSKKWIVNE